MGGIASVAAALGVAACGGPGPSGLSGSSSSARVTSALVARNRVEGSNQPSRPTTQGHDHSPRGSGSSPAQKSAPSPAWLVASAEAAQGWIASTNAFANASYTDDWKSPALGATEAATELKAAQSTLRSLSEEGIVTRGSPKILSVQVTSMSGSFAHVVGCVGGDQIEVYVGTGRPVGGISGKPGISKLVSADLVQTSTGWKVEKQSAKEDQCSPG
jgi:hypothetical protein